MKPIALSAEATSLPKISPPGAVAAPAQAPFDLLFALMAPGEAVAEGEAPFPFVGKGFALPAEQGAEAAVSEILTADETADLTVDVVADGADVAPLFAPVFEFVRPPEGPLAPTPTLTLAPLGEAAQEGEGQEAVPEFAVTSLADPVQLALPRAEGANPAVLPQAMMPGLAVPLAAKGAKPARAEGEPEEGAPVEPGPTPALAVQAVPIAEPLAVPPAMPAALEAQANDAPPEGESVPDAKAAPRRAALPTLPLRPAQTAQSALPPAPQKPDLAQPAPAPALDPAPAVTVPKPAAAVPGAPPMQADAEAALKPAPLPPAVEVPPAQHLGAAKEHPAPSAALASVQALAEVPPTAEPAPHPPEPHTLAPAATAPAPEPAIKVELTAPAAPMAATEATARPQVPVAPPAPPPGAPFPEAALNMRQADWGRQLLDRVERASRDGSELFEISLRPKTLGALRISLEVQGSHTSVHFVTETGAAARMLLGSEDKLSQLLDQSGFRLGGFSAQGGGAGSQSGQPQPQKDRTPVRNGKRPTATAPQSAPVQGAAGAGVNMLA